MASLGLTHGDSPWPVQRLIALHETDALLMNLRQQDDPGFPAEWSALDAGDPYGNTSGCSLGDPRQPVTTPTFDGVTRTARGAGTKESR